MAKSLRKAFDTDAALTILGDIQNQRSRYYYFLGRIMPWGADDVPPVEEILETELVNQQLRSEIAFVKRVAPGDASMVVKMPHWTPGEVYDEWDNTKQMVGKKFFVVTEDFRVYKCLDNNYGAESTHKPSGATIEPLRYPDGYLWKFLYTIPAIKRQKFYSIEYAPVQRALSDSFYNNGSIDDVMVKDQGSGYADVPLTTIQVVGSTTGTGALAQISAIDPLGSITQLSVVNPGSGYTKGAQLSIVGGGTDAVIKPVFGYINSIDIVDGGIGYTEDATITISPPNDPNGRQATAELVIVGGAIIDCVVTEQGSGYNETPSFTITDASGLHANATIAYTAGVLRDFAIVSGGFGYSTDDVVAITVGGAKVHPSISRATGSITGVTVVEQGAGYVSAPSLVISTLRAGGEGMYGNATAILQAIEYRGSVKSVLVIDPGKNYPVDTNTTISVQGTGEGAKFSPVIYEGKIIDVVIEDPGVGYSSIFLTAQSSVGSGAKFEAIIGKSDLMTEQSYIEQTTTPGAIYNVKVTDGGEGYTEHVTATIEGNGTGCVVQPVVEHGVLKRLDVLSPGSGYTHASVKIVDPARRNVNNELTNAAAYAILPPIGGHGVDAVRELYADTMQITTILLNQEISGNIEQDFRIYGILKDPRDLYTGGSFKANTEILGFKLRFDHVTGLSKDEVLKLGQNRYRIIDIEGLDMTLMPLDDNVSAPIGALTRIDDDSIPYIAQGISGAIPSLDKYSGDMIFVTTDEPFTLSPEQNIVARTFIKL